MGPLFAHGLPGERSGLHSDDVISVVVVTHNRAHLLQKCVDDVLLRTSPATTEIIVWNNGSEDDTERYLESVTDPRIRVVNHPENIGMNAYARAFRLAGGEYLIEMDDDVIEAPHGWDRLLLDAFLRIPRMGYLSASLVDDPHDSANLYVKYLMEERKAYRRKEEAGVRILEGPTGGVCTMTSRELYDRVGGFGERSNAVYWREDAAYVRKIHELGYRSAVLEDLKVWHAGSPYYSPVPQAKHEFHRRLARKEARKNAVKNVILRVPLARSLNERFDWFDPPHSYEFPQALKRTDESGAP